MADDTAPSPSIEDLLAPYAQRSSLSDRLGDIPPPQGTVMVSQPWHDPWIRSALEQYAPSGQGRYFADALATLLNYGPAALRPGGMMPPRAIPRGSVDPGIVNSTPTTAEDAVWHAVQPLSYPRFKYQGRSAANANKSLQIDTDPYTLAQIDQSWNAMVGKQEGGPYAPDFSGANEATVLAKAKPLLNRMRDQYGFTLMEPGLPKAPAELADAMLTLHRAIKPFHGSSQKATTYPSYGLYFAKPGTPLGRFEDGYSGNTGIRVPRDVDPADLSRFLWNLRYPDAAPPRIPPTLRVLPGGKE